MEEIVDIVSETYHVPVEGILGRSTRKDLSWCRHLAMYLSWEHGHDVTTIGKVMNRHHSTVIYGRDKIRDTIEVEVDTRAQIRAMLNDLRKRERAA